MKIKRGALITLVSVSAAFLGLVIRNMKSRPSSFAVQMATFLGLVGMFLFIILLIPYLFKLLRDSLRSDSIIDKYGNACRKGSFDYWFGILQILVVLGIVIAFTVSLLFQLIL